MATVTGAPARIDKLIPGTVVELEFCGSKRMGNAAHIEEAVFMGVTGNGEERLAKFISIGSDALKLYKWEAYRSAGRWVYGTSAERLKVVSQKFTV